MLEIVRRARHRHHNAVDLRVYHRVHVLLLLLVVFVRLAEQHVEAGAVGHGLGPFHHLRKKVAVDVRHNDAQRVAAAFAQGRRQVVGLVVELLGQLPHPLAGGGADARMAAQCPRNSGNSQVQLLGNVRDRSAFLSQSGSGLVNTVLKCISEPTLLDLQR